MAASTRLVSVVALLSVPLAMGCRARGSAPFVRPTHDDAGSGVGVVVDAGTVSPDSEPMTSPHALLAVQPPHGPFSGGTLVMLRGNGFSSNARVWFGATEVPASDVLSIDPHRVQVTAPAGDAGLADVSVQNGDDVSTLVTLPGGFAYDAFYAEPATGPTSGGTLVTVRGQGTSFDADTTVSIDRNPCEVVELRGPDELVCQAPAGTPGAKPMRVTTGDGSAVDVLDAFSYENSDNGFRGGLSGAPLRGSLKVLVLDSIQGNAIPGAQVIVGDDAPLLSKTDVSGVTVLNDRSLDGKATVTIARKCFQPVTFVDIPVNTLTAYLDPVLSPSCFSPEGDLEGGGGNPGRGASVNGELVWPESREFERDSWSNVPEPASSEEAKVAYVFQLSGRPTDTFRLPSALTAVTPTSEGTTGYRFSLSTSPGNATLYALAGIENRSRTPYSFTAYAIGLIRGVSVPAGKTTDDVFINVDVTLDHALSMVIDGPTKTAAGPDLIQANLAIRVGSDGYALLPSGLRYSLLNDNQSLDFVGIPPLVGTLSDTTYVAAVRAVTGSAGGLPRSVLGFLGATSTAAPLAVGPFVEVPVLSTPSRNGAWNARDLAWSSAPGGLAADLAIIDVETSAGLYNWRIVAPGARRSVRLPDLAAIDEDIAWPSGEQTLQIVLAQVQDFDLTNLRYRNLQERGWTAYAIDAFFASY
ncbi:MAG TPA: IPT/TIG domain-containing protein [Polyangiaceae bacterium]|nr:IPT/TIG domain-containing protein [Polyangiaceae bacterium]